MNPVLPIYQQIPEIKKALETVRCAVVQAPPGAGKTTRVPLALLSEPWLAGKKIILLEPRRLAAVSCAAHMAGLLKERVGQTIGYQIRLDRKTGPRTRVEVITEGIFTRKIQNDPFLEDTGLVIFDEFHERNIHSDLGLALCLESFEALRKDLRLLVMSATLDPSGLSILMNRAPVIVSEGKRFPVKTIYCPPVDRLNRAVPIESACESVIRQALPETRGDLLVFLPGVREIKNLCARFDQTPDPSIRVLPLYGELPQKAQALAFAPPGPGERKIVIATSIAETSITIDGICVVIDSGLMRVPRFSAQTGMTRLVTLPVSKAAADQRRGRAGRTAPGVCYRCWSEYDHGLLKAFTRPEILCVDLTGVVLELAAWGVLDPGQLKWLDLPEQTAFEQARTLLKTLGALEDNGQITAHGKKMACAGLHPRLAHMIIKGEEKGLGFMACRIAALLNEREILRFDKGMGDPDIRLRLTVVESVVKRLPVQKEVRINKGIIERIIASENKLAKAFDIKPADPEPETAGRLLALAYPDRIAKKRSNRENTFLLASGKGAFFTETHPVSISDYIVAVLLDGNPGNAKIFLAAPYSGKALEQDFNDRFKTVQTLAWDRKTACVVAKEEIFFEALVLDQRLLPDIDPDQGCMILMQEIKGKGLGILPWCRQLTSLRERAVFLKQTGLFPDLPDVSDRALETYMEEWLKPFLTGIFSLKALEQMDLESAFLTLLPWKARQIIEKNAPTHLVVPSGSRKPLKYTGAQGILDRPVLEVRLQELFGLCSTPKIAGQSLPVVLHLLSPAGRPVQITTDLESFWKNTYREVKKDLMGRYPKHYWPDDPLEAAPTHRAKPKKPVS